MRAWQSQPAFLRFPPGLPSSSRSPRTELAVSSCLPLPDKPPAGFLVLVDDFQDTYDGAAHGNTAAYAVRQQGFRGNIYAEEIGPDKVTGPSEASNAREWLGMGPQYPAKIRQAVQDLSRLSHRELLEDVTGDLNKIQKSGLHDSAVNVSYGVTPQRVA